MEIEKEVRVIRVDFVCPKCKEGRLRPKGSIFPTEPAIVPHSCNNVNCEHGENFIGVSYPFLKYEEIE